jgi:hypothetical protein
VRFTPGAGAVDAASWRMHKIGSSVSPLNVRAATPVGAVAVGVGGNRAVLACKPRLVRRLFASSPPGYTNPSGPHVRLPPLDPPPQILANGSHAVHGVSEDGVTVDSPSGAERLRIRPHDAPLFVRATAATPPRSPSGRPCLAGRWSGGAAPPSRLCLRFGRMWRRRLRGPDASGGAALHQPSALAASLTPPGPPADFPPAPTPPPYPSGVGRAAPIPQPL